MDYQVIWSEAAVADLESICRYIADDHPDAGVRIGRGILKHVRLLSTFSLIDPWYPRGTRGTLREIVFRNYRIFYDVSEPSRSVEILHVWHGAREEPSL